MKITNPCFQISPKEFTHEDGSVLGSDTMLLGSQCFEGSWCLQLHSQWYITFHKDPNLQQHYCGNLKSKLFNTDISMNTSYFKIPILNNYDCNIVHYTIL